MSNRESDDAQHGRRVVQFLKHGRVYVIGGLVGLGLMAYSGVVQETIRSDLWASGAVMAVFCIGMLIAGVVYND